MTIEPLNLTHFLSNYFSANQCKVTRDDDDLLTIQLTEEMDKAIMNRPFYWQYTQSTGQKGTPMTLVLQSNTEQLENNDKKVENIHFGSPRLHTIFTQLKQSAKYVRLFQNVKTEKNTMLYPWLVINMLVSFQGRQKKDELYSIGLHLINGTIVFGMMDRLNEIPLSQSISDYCYTVSPLIKITSGYERIINQVNKIIEKKPHDWARESLHMLHEELKLIHFFYEGKNNEEKELETSQVTERYHPKINYNVFGGGLFFLTQDFLTK